MHDIFLHLSYLQKIIVGVTVKLHMVMLINKVNVSSYSAFRKLKLEENVANIWPEFGSNRKDHIKVYNLWFQHPLKL